MIKIPRRHQQRDPLKAPSRGTRGCNPSAPWKAGLAGDDNPFDLAFWLTLLRADVFGSAQASVVARLRKHAPATAAIAEAMERIDDNAYAGCAAGYLAVADRWSGGVGHPDGARPLEAIFLLRQFGRAEAVADIVGPPRGALPTLPWRNTSPAVVDSLGAS